MTFYLAEMDTKGTQIPETFFSLQGDFLVVCKNTLKRVWESFLEPCNCDCIFVPKSMQIIGLRRFLFLSNLEGAVPSFPKWTPDTLLCTLSFLVLFSSTFDLLALSLRYTKLTLPPEGEKSRRTKSKGWGWKNFKGHVR